MKALCITAIAAALITATNYSRADRWAYESPCTALDLYLTYPTGSTSYYNSEYTIRVWNEDPDYPIDTSFYFEPDHFYPDVAEFGEAVQYSTYQSWEMCQVTLYNLPQGSYNIYFGGIDIDYGNTWVVSYY